MQLTKNFKLSEFACHDGTAVPDDLILNVQELAKNLQIFRDYINANLPFTKNGLFVKNLYVSIVSAYRTEKHNTKVGGAKKSQHLEAKAADIQVYGYIDTQSEPIKIAPIDVYKELEKMISAKLIKQGGLGVYNTFTHYDIRGTAARWDERTKK